MIKYDRDYDKELINFESQKRNPSPDGLFFVLERIFTQIEIQIYKTDDSGKIRYNAKGFPIINWIGVLWNLGKVIAQFVVLRKTYNNMRNGL